MKPLRLVILLLIVLAAAACRPLAPVPPIPPVPDVQSPQRISTNDPPLEPAAASRVSKGERWCELRYADANWRLCNIHYHRPAEHGRAFDGDTRVIPPCGAAEAGTGPNDWVELHYVFVHGTSADPCDRLRERALDEEHSVLGRDCPAPFVVRAVWARVKTDGRFDPKKDELPDSTRYAEYDGSSTGGSGGAFPVYWKINRDCVEISEETLRHVPRDPTRELQPRAPEGSRPRSTQGN